MESIFNPTLLWFSVVLIHMVTSVLCAVVKWFHVCRQYRHNITYYYPSRKWMCVLFMFILLEFPYLLNPNDNECFLVACTMLMWCYPIGIGSGSYIYFKTTKKDRHWSMVRTFIVVFAQVLMCIWALTGNHKIFTYDVVYKLVWWFNAIICVRLFFIYLYLKRKIKDNFYNDYSQEADFPINFANTILVIILSVIMVNALPMLFQSRALLAFMQIVAAVWNVFILLYTLDSKRTGLNDPYRNLSFRLHDENRCEYKTKDVVPDIVAIEHEEAVVEEDIEGIKVDIPKTVQEELLHKIQNIMEEQKPYLDSHFSLQQLINETGSNRTYLWQAIKLEYDSFFQMVNLYRVRYARKYMEENPKAPRKEVAQEAGFGSVKSLSRALENLHEQI